MCKPTLSLREIAILAIFGKNDTIFILKVARGRGDIYCAFIKKQQNRVWRHKVRKTEPGRKHFPLLLTVCSIPLGARQPIFQPSLLTFCYAHARSRWISLRNWCKKGGIQLGLTGLTADRGGFVFAEIEKMRERIKRKYIFYLPASASSS